MDERAGIALDGGAGPSSKKLSAVERSNFQRFSPGGPGTRGETARRAETGEGALGQTRTRE